jgi:hypothetical protein
MSDDEGKKPIEDRGKHSHKEFGQNLAAMSYEELFEARKQALRLRQREEFKEAWPSLDILLELLNRFIWRREGIPLEEQPD